MRSGPSGGAGSFNPNNTTTNATYTPTAGEITAGTVTLTLTTDDPSGPCGPVNDSMVITINPAATVIQVSARTGEGVDAWCDWLRARLTEVR